MAESRCWTKNSFFELLWVSDVTACVSIGNERSQDSKACLSLAGTGFSRPSTAESLCQ